MSESRSAWMARRKGAPRPHDVFLSDELVDGARAHAAARGPSCCRRSCMAWAKRSVIVYSRIVWGGLGCCTGSRCAIMGRDQQVAIDALGRVAIAHGGRPPPRRAATAQPCSRVARCLRRAASSRSSRATNTSRVSVRRRDGEVLRRTARRVALRRASLRTAGVVLSVSTSNSAPSHRSVRRTTYPMHKRSTSVRAAQPAHGPHDASARRRRRCASARRTRCQRPLTASASPWLMLCSL